MSLFKSKNNIKIEERNFITQKNNLVIIGFKDKLQEMIKENKSFQDRYCLSLDLADWVDESSNKLLEYRYNPLTNLPIETVYETVSMQRLAYALCVLTDDRPIRVNGVNCDHWNRMSIALLTAAFTNECYVAKHEYREPSMVNVYNNLISGTTDEILQEWINTLHLNGKCHPVVETIARQMLNVDYKEIANVFSNALANLNIWVDEGIIKATTANTRISNLFYDSEHLPVTLFVELPYCTFDFYAPLIRAFFVQLLDALRQCYRYDDMGLVDFICDDAIFPTIAHLTRGLAFAAFAETEILPKYKVCRLKKGAI